jgi:Fe-S cluster assembly protein SufD
MLNELTMNEISKKLNEEEWNLNRRKKALKEFSNLPFPSFKYGIGILVDVSDLKLDELNPLEDGDNFIVEGDGIKIWNSEGALVKYGEKIKDYFMKYYKDENKLDALHSAFFSKSAFIVIPTGKDVGKIKINLDLRGKTRIDNIFVIAEKGSMAKIVEVGKSSCADGQIIKSGRIDVIIEEGAEIEYRSIQNFGDNVYQFSKRNAVVQKNGKIYWIDCCVGSKFSQINTRTYLEGLGADGKSWGVAFGDKKQCYDFNNETIHVASKTKSDMLTRVVLNGNARTVYRGLVKIERGAVGCEGYQKDDTILLDENARADAVPNLEIGNNDVKCSHGATISQVDEDKLFYMMSRGLSEKNAKKAIVEGFFDPIVSKLGDEELQNNLIEQIAKRLEAI